MEGKRDVRTLTSVVDVFKNTYQYLSEQVVMTRDKVVVIVATTLTLSSSILLPYEY